MFYRVLRLFFISCILLSCNSLFSTVNSEVVKQKDLYRAVYRGSSGFELDKVSETLKKVKNPNYCIGESGWSDSNTLSVVAESFYSTYIRLYDKREVPYKKPDVEVFNILLEHGADLSERPFIWERVNLFNNLSLEMTIDSIKIEDENITNNDIKQVQNWYIQDCNRLLVAFLEAGANPDMLGHPYPFSYEGMKEGMTDEKADEYFKNGTRAINVAIEKGIVWESQIDLLLEYTTLDEESLEAAKRSNDPLMIEKINTLWKEQQN